MVVIVRQQATGGQQIVGLWPFVSDESSDFSGRNSALGTALRRGTT